MYMKKIIKQIRYLLEAFLVYFFYFFFKLMPIDAASAVGAAITRNIGPLLPVNRVAYRNLRMCYPEKTESEIAEIIKGMWDNLGRIVGESPHIINFSKHEYKQRVKTKPKDTSKLERRSLFISGHIGNFEVAAKLGIEEKLGLNLVYRPANNPYVDYLIRHLRARDGIELMPKGKKGLVQILQKIEAGKCVGMLVDQKMSDGIETTFFGHPVKTTSLPAKLAIKYKLPIYVACMKRVEGAQFLVEFRELKIKEGDTVESVTQRINDILEAWVREAPEQWFWLHKRWG